MHVLVKRLAVGRSEPCVECRDCGTTLPPTPDACPTCGSVDAVAYETA